MYRQEGAASTLEKFAAQIGVSYDRKLSNVGLPQKNAQIAVHNQAAFFKHDASAVAQYALDLAALQAVQQQLVIAGGSEGHDFFPYRCAVALAERLETTVIDFPGHHAGFVNHPKEFAEKLREVLM